LDPAGRKCIDGKHSPQRSSKRASAPWGRLPHCRTRVGSKNRIESPQWRKSDGRWRSSPRRMEG
jgi:hypothetical protein